MTITQSGSLAVNNARLAYDIRGEGSFIVLMHAGICDRRMWDDQFELFAETHRVLRYDVRGFGESDFPPGEFSHHADLDGLLNALGIERAVLIAVSMAGEIALKAALTYPKLVSRLVLSTTRAGSGEPSDAIKKLWTDADAAYEAGNLAEAVEIENRGWVDGQFRTPDKVDTAVRERVRVMNTALWERIAQEPEAGEEAEFSPPVRERLSEIGVPSLLITGDLDQPDVVSSMECLAAGIPNAERILIEGPAHLPSMEKPEVFNEAVLSFLERNRL